MESALFETSYDIGVEDAVDRHNLSGRKGVSIESVPVVGLKFRGFDQNTWRAKGNPLILRPEPENEFDSKAIAVYCGRDHIGYIPKDCTDKVRAVISEVCEESTFPALMSGETPTIFIFRKHG